MSNLTYMTLTNRVLSESGQDAIPDATTFNNNAAITKPQFQTKLAVDKVNTAIMRNVRAWWLKQIFSITTVAWNGLQGAASNNSYQLDPSTSFENVVEHSFINTTLGRSGTIKYLNFERWQRFFPQGEFVAASPTYWMLLPTYGPAAVTSGNGNIAFSSPPNQAYTITYEAYVDPVALVNATDVVMWPPKYTDIFVEWSRKWLEIDLAEGKSPEIEQFLEPLFAQLRLLSLGPTEDTPHVTLGGIKIGGRQMGGRRTVWDWIPSDQVS